MYPIRNNYLAQIWKRTYHYLAEDLNDYLENIETIPRIKNVKTHLNGTYSITTQAMGKLNVEVNEYLRELQKRYGGNPEKHLAEIMALSDGISEILLKAKISQPLKSQNSLEVLLSPEVLKSKKISLGERNRNSLGIDIIYDGKTHTLVDVNSGTQDYVKEKNLEGQLVYGN